MNASSVYYYLGQIMEYLWTAQSEIAIFAIAYLAHALWFGRLRLPYRKSEQTSHDDVGSKTRNCKSASSPRQDSHHEASTFNEKLEAASRRNIDDMMGIIDQMKESAVRPNHATYAILLKSIQGNLNAAGVTRILAVFDDSESQIDESTFIALIETHIRLGRPDLLVSCLKKHSKTSFKSPHSYGILIRAYGFIGNLEGVWETWNGMRKRHILPASVTLGCMVEALNTNGDVDASYKLISEMLSIPSCKPLVNSVIYGSVLKGLSHQKRFERVWSVYQEMLNHKLSLSIITFNTLLDACARSQDLHRVPSLLEKMTEQGIEANIITYSIVIKAYCQENKLQEALQVWDSMIQTTNFKPDEIMYNTILDGCARQGFYERGLELLEHMENAGVRPSNFTLSVLVKLASRSKMLDKAFELSEQVSKRHKFRLNVHVYNNLVAACTVHNALPRAFAVLGQMLEERVRPDVRTYTLIVKACMEKGDRRDAIGLVRSAMGLDDAHPRLARAAQLAQLQKGLPADFLVEVLECISGQGHDDGAVISLWNDLRRKVKLSLPSHLQLRLTKQAMS
jgi:pentatricopeptide repeat protein|mmetsp:Transcript_47469/g.75042  ORF Transcript_47469/g.75042 Transcript_47469/m.75042 type:complete len:566 (-) Transcript_47469:160-1857(-)